MTFTDSEIRSRYEKALAEALEKLASLDVANLTGPGTS
jgi:hypothetical protein